MTIFITRSMIERIVDHARATSPLEGCGLLGIQESIVCRFVAIENIDRSRNRYSGHIQQQMDAQRLFRSFGAIVWGVYHSHPGGRCLPSELDRKLAENVPYHQIIIALTEGGRYSLGSYAPGYSQEIDFSII